MSEHDPQGYEVTNLPQLQSADELKAQQPPDFLKNDEWFGTVINKDEWLDFKEAYTKPNFLLSFRGRPFARMGDVQVISGQAGHGKSMLLSQIITAIFHGEFGGLRYELADTIPQPIVLLIDTEQSKVDVIGGKNRICQLCGWGLQEERPEFQILMLRNTETAIERWKKVLMAIYTVKPNVIILDGIIDIVQDFNNQTECADIIYKCMITASHYEAAMMCVLHQNPLSTKLVGHLGSAAMRKVTDILTVTKDKTQNDVIFKVTETKARGHQDIEDWKFRVLPVDGYGRPEQIDESTDIDDIDLIHQWLRDGQELIKWPATITEIKRIIKECGGVGSSDRQQRDVEAAKNRRFIIEQPREEWQPGQRHPKFYLHL